METEGGKGGKSVRGGMGAKLQIRYDAPRKPGRVLQDGVDSTGASSTMASAARDSPYLSTKRSVGSRNGNHRLRDRGRIPKLIE